MSNQPSRVRVLLFFGGASSEHQISCLTAAGVIEAIDSQRFEVVAVGITHDGDWVRIANEEVAGYHLAHGHLPEVAADRPNAILLPGERPAVATRDGDRLRDIVEFDVAFALLHGPFGEDGTIQGQFEMAGVRYVGSGVAASAISMDKDLMKRALASAGLPVGPWLAITAAEWRDDRQGCLNRVSELSFPVFVKPARGGSSLGIVKADTIEEVPAAIAEAQKYDPKLVIEQGFVGIREIEVAVLGNPEGAPKASLPGEIALSDSAAFYDFETKYLPDSQDVSLQVPAKLDPQTTAEVRALAARTFAAMAVEGLARIDLFLTSDGELFVNELNTMPGFTHTSMFPMLWAATGLAYSDLITTLIELATARPLGLR
jgi:D-alanine-D-alanine ligase